MADKKSDKQKVTLNDREMALFLLFMVNSNKLILESGSSDSENWHFSQFIFIDDSYNPYMKKITPEDAAKAVELLQSAPLLVEKAVQH